MSPSHASPETILQVDLDGTAVVLDEFGRVVARGGSGVVISSQSGHRLPALTQDDNAPRVMAQAVRWGQRGARINTISPGIS